MQAFLMIRFTLVSALCLTGCLQLPISVAMRTSATATAGSGAEMTMHMQSLTKLTTEMMANMKSKAGSQSGIAMFTKHMPALVANMSLSRALDIVHGHPSVSGNLKAFIQEHVGTAPSSHGRRSHLRAGHGHQSRSLIAVGTPAPDLDPEQSIQELNNLTERSQEKVDAEEAKCAKFRDTMLGLIEETRQDMTQAAAKAAIARRAVLAAKLELILMNGKGDMLNSELIDALAAYGVGENSSEAVLEAVNKDLASMNALGERMHCPTAAEVAEEGRQRRLAREAAAASGGGASSLLQLSAPGMQQTPVPAMHALVQCTHQETGEESVMFHHSELQERMDSLSPALRDKVHGVLKTAFRNAPDSSKGEAYIETRSSHLRFRSNMSDPEQSTPGIPTSAHEFARMAAKCIIANNPDCQEIAEKFLYLQAGCESQADKIAYILFLQEKGYGNVKGGIEAQLRAIEGGVDAEQEALAGATGDMQKAQEETRLKEQQEKDEDAEFAELMKLCAHMLAQLMEEICGLQKVRGELLKKSGDNRTIIDCEVSPWESGACSQLCGGGTKTLTRSVLLNPDGGADCPPTAMTQSCNEKACGIDCRVSDWQGWSSCTAECGGGVRSRDRNVLQPSSHGGTPCQNAAQTETCNSQSCDQDCVLGDWLEWGPCTKACNGGEKTRYKEVQEHERGNGKCANKDSPFRAEEASCNAQDCRPTHPDGILRCQSKIDVYLLIDSPPNDGGSIPIAEYNAVHGTDGGTPVSTYVQGSYRGVSTMNQARYNSESEAVAACSSIATCPGYWQRISGEFYIGGSASHQWASGRPNHTVRKAMVRSVRANGWESAQSFVRKFANSMQGDEDHVKLGVLTFGGPSNWQKYEMCIGKVRAVPNLETDCGIKWVTRLTSNMNQVRTDITNSAWSGGGSSFTSGAMALAESALNHGRIDAESVVIMITDGEPLNDERTREAAMKLREKARVMMVPVTGYAPVELMREMASEPKADNFIQMHDFNTLGATKSLNTVVANFCNNVV